MPLFSQFFQINKSQSELDFVDVELERDIKLFLDPFAISQRPDRWSRDCHATIVHYFQSVVDAIRANHHDRAQYLLSNLHEPNETRFGLSSGVPRGNGIDRIQAEELHEALRNSTAVRTGFLTSLEECELLIPGISHDKVSDLTTNILKKRLEEYTHDQCELFSIPTQAVALGPYYEPDTGQWLNDYYRLPIANDKPILLVPKVLARRTPSHDHAKYYNHFVLDYLQSEHLSARSSLVHTFKNGRQVVRKKDLKEHYPLTKQFLFEFSREHPEILRHYREYLADLERRGEVEVVSSDDEVLIARSLIDALGAIAPGSDEASTYHDLMIGALEFMFFPELIKPRKEQGIHNGRKRIDILMENGAQSGIFRDLHSIRGLPCAYVPIECKNYSQDVHNPQLDQLAGRFSVNRGKFGMLTIRTIRDRNILIERCRDALRDDRGLIIVLDDEKIVRLLELIGTGMRHHIDDELRQLISEIWVS